MRCSVKWPRILGFGGLKYRDRGSCMYAPAKTFLTLQNGVESLSYRRQRAMASLGSLK